MSPTVVKDIYGVCEVVVEEALCAGNVVFSVDVEECFNTIEMTPVNALVLAQALSVVATKALIQAKDSK